MKSFEANCSRLLDSFNRSPHLVDDEKNSGIEEENHHPEDCPSGSEKRLNTTYDLDPCDDSMKENLKPVPPLPSSSPPRPADINNSVIVIEEDSGFFIYEKSEVNTPDDKETKKVFYFPV